MALTIDGVEITQAIQYFQSPFPVCGPPGGRIPCADNSLPVVEGKDTVIRVYVGGAVSGPGHRLNGVGLPTVGPWLTATPMLPPSTPIDRTRADQTLNFLLTAPVARGTVTVPIHIWDSDPSGGGVSTTVTITFQKTQLIPVRLVRINYRGRGLNLPAPSLADFFNAADEFLTRVFPVPHPGVSVVRDSVEVYDGNFSSTLATGGLAGLEGTTGTVWQILERLMLAETLAPNVLYGALVPSGSLPTGPNTSRTVFPAGYIGRRFFALPSVPDLMATMIAHILWEVVSPCLAVTSAEAVYAPPPYPTMSTLPGATIAEVGMDVRTRQALDPNVYKDLLSGLASHWPWISPYTYQGLARRLTCVRRPPRPPRPPGSESPFSLPDRPVLDVTLVRDRLDRYTLVDLPTWIVPRPLPPLNEVGPYFVELRAADGRVLVRQGLGAWQVQDAEAGDARLSVSLPWVDAATTLALVEGDRALLTHTIEGAAPRLRVDFNPRGIGGRKPLVLRWQAGRAKSRDRVAVLVRASGDGGQTWLGIPASPTAGKVAIDPPHLPGGDGCVVEVFASRGIRTARWISKPFPVAREFQTPCIVKPVPGTRVHQGDPVEFFGVPAVGSDGLDELIWSSNVDGKLGTGSRLIAPGLSVGEHTIELRAAAYPDRIDRLNLIVGPSRRRVSGARTRRRRL